MPNLNFEVPEELHKEFKIACIKTGKDMQVVLIELMQKFVKQKGGN